jgi:hypothetical protein
VGDRALRIKFEGERNVYYRGINQYVTVVPGATYRVRAQVLAQDITSAQGPFIAVDGMSSDDAPPCDLWARTDDLKSADRWSDVGLEFTVPERCEGVRISVMRPRTQRLNQFIEGELWLDDVKLELVTLTPPQPVEAAGAASELSGSIAALVNAVQGSGDVLAGKDHARPVGDELPGTFADESDGSLEGFGQARRTFVGGVGIAGHGVEQPAPQEVLGTRLRALAPDSEQGIAVELEERAGTEPLAHEAGTVLNELVPLGMREDGKETPGAQGEDGLRDCRRDDCDRHLQQHGASSAQGGELVGSLCSVTRREIDLGAGQNRQGDVCSAQPPVELVD